MSSSRPLVPELATIKIHGMTRQAFLLRATLAAGATYGAGMVTPFVSSALAQDGNGDVDILNFALTLEYLEATFYERAVKQVKGLSADEMKLVRQLRDDENAHVKTLRETIEQLDGTPAKKPTFDYMRAFASRTAFLRTSNIFEDTGVSAYNGAAPMIQSKEILAAAGSIVQVEGRHAALIRLARGVSPAPRAFDKASQQEEVLDAVQPFIRS